MPDAVATISPDKLAQLTGLSVIELSGLASKGYFPKPRQGVYEQNRAIPGCFRALQDRLSEAGTLPVYESMAQCSEQTGIPKSVLKAARKESAESFRAHRILLGPLLKWLFTKNGDDQDWGDALKKYQALREEIKLAKDRQQVAERTEVEAAIVKGMALVFNTMEREFTVQLPPQLKGLSESEIQQQLSNVAESFKAILRSELSSYIPKKNDDKRKSN
jgi:hypothetical protein